MLIMNSLLSELPGDHNSFACKIKVSKPFDIILKMMYIDHTRKINGCFTKDNFNYSIKDNDR